MQSPKFEGIETSQEHNLRFGGLLLVPIINWTSTSADQRLGAPVTIRK
jgi:hypothetical protein